MVPNYTCDYLQVDFISMDFFFVDIIIISFVEYSRLKQSNFMTATLLHALDSCRYISFTTKRYILCKRTSEGIKSVLLVWKVIFWKIED